MNENPQIEHIQVNTYTLYYITQIRRKTNFRTFVLTRIQQIIVETISGLN